MATIDFAPDRLTLSNRERRAAGMAYTYADGFGTWHAVIPPHIANPARVAQRMIREELDMRGALGKGYRVRVKLEAGRGRETDSARYVEA